MSYMQEESNSFEQQYDAALIQAQQLNQMLQKLANKDTLEDLADQTTPQDYMNLLASLIYSLNSTMFCYTHVKAQQMPPQFKKVKDYYSKIKDLIAGKIPKKELNPLTVDKEAAMRMIKAGIRPDPGQK